MLGNLRRNVNRKRDVAILSKRRGVFNGLGASASW